MLLVLLGAVGCHDRRGEECRSFVVSVNGKLDEIDRVTNNTPAHDVSAADMRHLAGLYDALAKNTSSPPLTTKELSALRTDYHVMVLEAAKLARTVADALDAKDLETAMKAHERFAAVVTKEDILVSKVNAFCQAR